ncbi:MAG: ASKHA domain-containing protein [Butyrivibrio sp.]|nr:ASKHA domain-containing protein [Butyrivibrio sp.]
MRTIVVVFQFKDGRQKIVETSKGKRLVSLINDEGIYLSVPCGGNGHCGQCKVRFYSGETPVTDSDRRYITGEDLDAGYRLACRVVLKEDCVIELPQESSSVGMSEDMSIIMATDDKDSEKEDFDPEGIYGIGLDIGTTTLAASFVKLEDGQYRIISQSSCINHQRKYGGDVISRIQAAEEGKDKAMQNSILTDIQNLFADLIVKTGFGASKVTERIKMVTIAGNTTMLHILMGYPCKGLGKFPYQPHNLELISSMACFVLPGVSVLKDHTKVTILPGISAFVGADIVSGMYALGFDDIPPGDYAFMLDLGTNGEMAVGNRNHILTAATAAGPVFEGGGISRGIGSVSGAICHVLIDHEKPVTETINNEKAVGICGTGVLETVSELRRCRLINDTGLMREDIFEKGYNLGRDNFGKSIYFTQADVRQVQLAKAAIKAGIDTVISEFGSKKTQEFVDKISKVFIAGGFGYRLKRESLYPLKMLPEKFVDKMQSVGNTSLLGTLKYMAAEQKEADSGKESLEIIVRAADEVELALDNSFGGVYYDAINF